LYKTYKTKRQNSTLVPRLALELYFEGGMGFSSDLTFQAEAVAATVGETLHQEYVCRRCSRRDLFGWRHRE
jgi:hypothetical protein